MKRSSATYRLQLIKEVSIRRDRQLSNDPMANHIQSLIDNESTCEQSVHLNQRFSGNHFDDDIGGWVSNNWGDK